MMFASDLGTKESLARKFLIPNLGKHGHTPKILFCLLLFFLNSADIRKYPYVFVDIYSVVRI